MNDLLFEIKLAFLGHQFLLSFTKISKTEKFGKIQFSSVSRFKNIKYHSFQQSIGYAFYLHLLGTLCYLVAFICAMTTTYKFISGSEESRR